MKLNLHSNNARLRTKPEKSERYLIVSSLYVSKGDASQKSQIANVSMNKNELNSNAKLRVVLIRTK